jgi:Helix-turn-helix domain
VTQDDLLYRFRLRTFVMAGELGNVWAACRAMGIHPSTCYRWKRQLERYGPEILRPPSGVPHAWPIRPACWSSSGWSPSPSATPGFGPARIAAELVRPRWGGISLSPNGVWRVLA